MKVVHRDDLPAVKGDYCARRESISGMRLRLQDWDGAC